PSWQDGAPAWPTSYLERRWPRPSRHKRDGASAGDRDQHRLDGPAMASFDVVQALKTGQPEQEQRKEQALERGRRSGSREAVRTDEGQNQDARVVQLIQSKPRSRIEHAGLRGEPPEVKELESGHPH